MLVDILLIPWIQNEAMLLVWSCWVNDVNFLQSKSPKLLGVVGLNSASLVKNKNVR